MDDPGRLVGLPSRLAALLLFVAAWGSPLAAAERTLEATDADIRSLAPIGLDEALGRALEASRESGEPLWLAYRVEGVPREGSLCCYRSGCCDLEHEHGTAHIGRPEVSAGPVIVLLRLDRGAVHRMRVVSEDCPLGFGGRRVLWAGDIAAAESLSVLGRWIDDDEGSSGRLSEGPPADDTLAVIAYHRGVGATELLAEVASTSRSIRLAKSAAFWLGVARGREGYERLIEILGVRPEEEIRKGVVFALSQSSAPEADETLVSLARGDRDPEIRREALFWLGQEGTGHGELILEAALTESDRAVAKHAVFVLSQLPEPLNVELLTRVLEQRQRPELRKEALFWIGQSDTPDALAIVTRILSQ